MKLVNKFSLQSTVQLSKIISSQIAKVKVYVMYAGKNRNHTHFSKEMIEQKLVPTMYGMPIIGEYNKEKQDFGGHGGRVIIENGEITQEQTTVAYGFIPESADMRWEMVTERDGITQREYLVTDAYVWYKRFPEIEAILDEPKGQSMEIEISEGTWSDELNSYDIQNAEFTGCCVLGVEPCFESAKIGRFTLEQMKYEYTQMAKELKETLLRSEVTEEMNQELETQVEVEETVESQEVVETEGEEVVEVAETEEVTETEEVQEESVEETEEVVEATEEAPAVEEQEEQEVETEVEQSETEVEVTETEVEQSETEAEVTETVDYAKENADMKAKIEGYEAELAELRAFKADIDMQEKQGVVDGFKSEFTDEELAPVVEKMEQFSKEDLEIQLFALLGKKQKQYTANKQNADVDKVVTVAKFEVEEDNIPLWARAIEQHKK